MLGFDRAYASERASERRSERVEVRRASDPLYPAALFVRDLSNIQQCRRERLRVWLAVELAINSSGLVEL